ncbi:MAG TPA: nucleoside triphosphate pyrophosphohydrolase, partial [Candidatus Saccharimonadia bacterium]|nr:nucleoside triphosphate pyrophosphohydrolase [Candidatus Saccharimonadia bacterium]
EILKQKGKQFRVRELSGIEYLEALIAKLKEETTEFEHNPSLEELADLQEVILAILNVLGKEKTALEAQRKKKANDRGAFKEKVFLIEAEE